MIIVYSYLYLYLIITLFYFIEIGELNRLIVKLPFYYLSLYLNLKN
jgi:hypothetical protein